MFRAISCFCLCTLFFMPISLYAQANDGRSYIDALRLNTESLQSYDVLIEVSRSEGLLRQIDDRTRLKIDYANKRAILFRLTKSKITKPDGTTERAVNNYSCWLNGESCSEYFYDRPPRKNKRTQFATSLENLMFPVVDRVAVIWYPAIATHLDPPYGSDDEKKRWWARMRDDLSYAKPNATSQECTLTIASSSTIVTGMTHSDVYAYLPESFTPSSRTLTRHNKLWIQNPNQIIKRETYKWGEFEGMHVPVQIVRDELMSIEGSPEEMTEITRFHWIALNSEFPESEFSVELQTDPQQIIKQTSDSVRDRALELTVITK